MVGVIKGCSKKILDSVKNSFNKLINREIHLKTLEQPLMNLFKAINSFVNGIKVLKNCY